MEWIQKEMSYHSGQSNDGCMYIVLEIKVYWSLNGYAWIQWLGIASLSYSDSELHSSKLTFLNVSFQDSHSSNFTLNGYQLT